MGVVQPPLPFGGIKCCHSINEMSITLYDFEDGATQNCLGAILASDAIVCMKVVVVSLGK